MPGIAGVISRRQSSAQTEILDKMIEPLVRQEWHRSKKVVTPHVGLASISLFDISTISISDNIIISVAGEVADEQPLRARLVAAGEVASLYTNTADLLLASFMKFGVRSLCDLNGLYVVAIWEETYRRLTVINDRYGLRKLYYWNSDEAFFFASEYKAISQLPQFNKVVNPIALTDLLTVGFLMDDRTLFENIRILPGASILTYQEGVVSLERYWDYPSGTRPNLNKSETEYVDEMAERTRDALRRRVRDNTCILITAGLDSRAVAGFYRQVAPEAVVASSTLGRETCLDVRIGKQVSERLGMKHINVPIPANYLDEYAETCVWRTEGNMSCYTGWIFAEEKPLLERGFRYAMTGIGGEVISGRQWLFEKQEPDIGKALALYYNKNNYHLLKNLVKPSIYKNVGQESFNTIRTTVENAPVENPLNKLDYMEFHQDFRRHATSIDVLGDVVIVYDPLVDNDLMDFALSLPPKLRAGAYLYKRMIARHLPGVASIGNAVRGNSFPPLQGIQNRRYWKFVERVGEKVRREIRHAKSFSGDNPASSIQPNLWMRTSSRAYIQKVLKRREYLEDYLNMDECDRIIQEHITGKRNAYRIISAVLTFALWQQVFCDHPIIPEQSQGNEFL